MKQFDITIEILDGRLGGGVNHLIVFTVNGDFFCRVILSKGIPSRKHSTKQHKKPKTPKKIFFTKYQIT